MPDKSDSSRNSLYSSFYDSIRQRHYAERILPKDAHERSIRARLRFDWFLHGQITMTDNQVLDGALFRSLRRRSVAELFPPRVLELLGRPALSIRSPFANPEHALLGFVRKSPDDMGPFEGFDFSSIHADHSEMLKAHLVAIQGAFNANAGIRELAQAMQDAGIDSDYVEQYTTSWQELCAVIRGNPEIEITRVNARRDQVGSFTQGFELTEDGADQLRANLRTISGRNAVEDVLQHLHLRGKALEVLAQHAAVSMGDDERIDIEHIRQWFNRCFNRSEAMRLRCDFESVAPVDAFNTPRIVSFEHTRIEQERKLGRSLMIEIPQEFLIAFARLPANELDALMLQDGNKVLTLMAQWWDHRDVGALRQSVDVLLNRMDTSVLVESIHPLFRIGHRLLLTMSDVISKSRLAVKVLGLIAESFEVPAASDVAEVVANEGDARSLAAAGYIQEVTSSQVCEQVVDYGLHRIERF